MDQPPVITRENIQAILKYAPCFEGDVPKAAERCGGDDGIITIPAAGYSGEME